MRDDAYPSNYAYTFAPGLMNPSIGAPDDATPRTRAASAFSPL